MIKWADYAIISVRFKEDKRHIKEVKIKEDSGEKLINERIVPREEVVKLLDGGFDVITVYKKDGKWHKGDEVGIVEIRETKFIRTDGNSIEVDNLGELPEF